MTQRYLCRRRCRLRRRPRRRARVRRNRFAFRILLLRGSTMRVTRRPRRSQRRLPTPDSLAMRSATGRPRSVGSTPASASSASSTCTAHRPRRAATPSRTTACALRTWTAGARPARVIRSQFFVSPICDPSRGVCVDCLAGEDCKGKSLFGVPIELCRRGFCVQCEVEADCADTKRHCQSREGICVDCLKNDQCPTGLQCFNGRCIPT